MLSAADELAAAGIMVDAVEGRVFMEAVERLNTLRADDRLGAVVVVALETPGLIAEDAAALGWTHSSRSNTSSSSRTQRIRIGPLATTACSCHCLLGTPTSPCSTGLGSPRPALETASPTTASTSDPRARSSMWN